MTKKPPNLKERIERIRSMDRRIMQSLAERGIPFDVPAFCAEWLRLADKEQK